MLKETYGWDISEKHQPDQRQSKWLLLPIQSVSRSTARRFSQENIVAKMPEYIGYGDAGIIDDIFYLTIRIELLENGAVPNTVDFEQLKS